MICIICSIIKKSYFNNKKKLNAISIFQTAVDLGGPRKELFSLLIRLIQREFFDPVREWSNEYEVVGKIMGKTC